MSSPKSRLSKLRSYSYYHVLAMCDSTTTADLLAKSVDVDVWNHATPDTRAKSATTSTQSLGKYSPKELTGGGKYIILINGSTDASFTITSAKWSSATAANAVNNDQGTSIAIEGTLNISEPKGIAFLDQVVKCSVALGVDSSQVIYVLKTFFVGHGADISGLSEVDVNITDIPPINLTVYDVTGSFTESGGFYEMSFVAVGHGTARLPQYSRLPYALNVQAGSSLEKTLKALEASINTEYDKFYECVLKQIASVPGVDTSALQKSLRKVKYIIDVGDEYKDTAGQVKYTVTNQVSLYKTKSGCGEPVHTSFQPGMSIEEVISQVMKMSPQVQAEMATGDGISKVRYEYKIHSTIKSTASQTNVGQIDYTVFYVVKKFMVPKTISYDPSFQMLAEDDPNDEKLRTDPRFDRIRRNLIDFEYLYTGNNVDILEFDMKLNMGLSYIQTATLANTFKSQIERAPNRQTQPSAQDVATQGTKYGGPIVQTPVFFGSQVKMPIWTNTQNAGLSIQSLFTLNKHASLEVADVSMKIIGNDMLLGSTNRTSSPDFIMGNQSSNQDNKTNTPLAPTFHDWSLVPAYARVKIKMPRNNDDISLLTGQSTSGDPRFDVGITDYARDFWFDGYYYVYGIDHNFEEGVFTQTLHMISIPKTSTFEATKKNATKDVDMTHATAPCFNNQIKCGTQTGGNSQTNKTTVPHELPAGTKIENREDANAVASSADDLSAVRGWDDKASPAVKDAIKNAAKEYNVNVVTLAQIAAHETGYSFNPSAVNPSPSHATGLFQIITSTWKSLIEQRRINGLTQTEPDMRKDPVYNARGGAALLSGYSSAINSSKVGDLYLAHFAGEPVAREVIKSDNSTGGSQLLSSVMAGIKKADFNRIKRENPTIINDNTTVGELRTWCAQVMANTLKKPINVAEKTKKSPPPAPSPNTPQPEPQPNSSSRTAGQARAATIDCETQKQDETNKTCGPTAADAERESSQNQPSPFSVGA